MIRYSDNFSEEFTAPHEDYLCQVKVREFLEAALKEIKARTDSIKLIGGEQK